MSRTLLLHLLQRFSSVLSFNAVVFKDKYDTNTAFRFRKANIAHSYYRFDVDRGLEAVELNESDSEALQMISAVTKSYLKGRQTEVERCARSLKPRSSE